VPGPNADALQQRFWLKITAQIPRTNTVALEHSQIHSTLTHPHTDPNTCSWGFKSTQTNRGHRVLRAAPKCSLRFAKMPCSACDSAAVTSPL